MMRSTTAVLYTAMLLYQATMIQTQVFDIVLTAAGANFTTLVAAVAAADLVTTLQGTGPFTVFAPTNAAFDKLAAGTLTDLLKPENKAKLTRILKYHVIANKNLTSAQILALSLPATVDMLDGGAITVSKNGNDLKVNDAKVIRADVMATNGIIHAIDTVLMPSSATYLYGNQLFFFAIVSGLLFSFLRF